MKQTAKIENWSLVRVRGELYLMGQVTDHPRQEDFQGGNQMTSRIVAFDRDKSLAETENTVYTLGAPVPELKKETSDVE